MVIYHLEDVSTNYVCTCLNMCTNTVQIFKQIKTQYILGWIEPNFQDISAEKYHTIIVINVHSETVISVMYRIKHAILRAC